MGVDTAKRGKSDEVVPTVIGTQDGILPEL